MSDDPLDPIVESYLEKMSRKHQGADLEQEMLKGSFKLALQLFAKKYDDLPQGEQWHWGMASVLDMGLEEARGLVRQFQTAGWVTAQLTLSSLGTELLTPELKAYWNN